jgi:hypothetical protein
MWLTQLVQAVQAVLVQTEQVPLVIQVAMAELQLLVN